MPQLLTDLRMTSTIERDTYQLFAQSITGTTVTLSPASRTTPFYTAVTLTNWTLGEGSVVVTGTLAGVTVTSTLVFTGNEHRVGLNQEFDTLISVATQGFTANAGVLGSLLGFILGAAGDPDVGNVRVDAVSRTGQPKEELTTVAINVPCRITRERFGGLQQSVGEASIDAARIYFFPWQDLKRQDRVVADGDRWKIKGLTESFRLSDGQPYYKIAVVHSEEQV